MSGLHDPGGGGGVLALILVQVCTELGFFITTLFRLFMYSSSQKCIPICVYAGL